MTLDRFFKIRKRSIRLTAPLLSEDFVIQPMQDVSPPKWHLAHTTWFFEQFVLRPYFEEYKEFHPDFAFLFNSYYNHVGDRNRRDQRGFMSRPPVGEVMRYRQYVEEQLNAFWTKVSDHPEKAAIIERMELGMQHEQQHQELLLTDIKYILGIQPLFPVYELSNQSDRVVQEGDNLWLPVDSGVYEIGFKGEGFCFDNELGSHKVYVDKFSIASNVVTNGEYLEFMNAGAYSDFTLWLAEGWDWVQQEALSAPLYWHRIDGKWFRYTLSGLQEIVNEEVLMHISHFEADAFARWRRCRLPTEQEWEIAASIHRLPMESPVWEWTGSAYLAYPGFKTAVGALGEYNGKFMSNQTILRGGSLATPEGHYRTSYRNFFHSKARWQFNGIRLVKDI